MIKTVADFLQQLMERETEALDAVKLAHAPTIGDMYEGLSLDLLGRAVPQGLGLQLVSGFAIDGLGGMSGQLDCMLVRGEGTNIPFTPSKIWHIKDVIAVFEIKKTLYSGSLADAFQHLNTVKALELTYGQSRMGHGDIADFSSVNRAFAETVRQIAPAYEELATLGIEREMLYHTLMTEHHGALRIVLGFHGFKTESSFRGALVSLLRSQVGIRGYGVASFPQLIISGSHCAAKATGEPFSIPMTSDDWWPFYFSTSLNTLNILLEYIWSRLDRLYEIGGLWGEDLEVEVPNPLLLAKAARQGDQIGWLYEFVELDEGQLAQRPGVEPWAPVLITVEQSVVINLLGSGAVLPFDDPSLLAFLEENDIDAQGSFFDDLIATGLVARSSDSMGAMLITEQCVIAILPDGRIVAGENNTGRLTRWVHGQTLKGINPRAGEMRVGTE